MPCVKGAFVMAETSKKQNGKGRTRNYATVVYPESAPQEWRKTLENEHIRALISPLHDKDINADGTPKKPHWHVLFMFEGPKTLDQARSVAEKIGGVGCEVINGLRGYARYLTHADNPEKAQYNSADVVSLGGADYLELCALPSDKYKAIGEMLDWCVENDVLSYGELLMYARANQQDWFRVLCDSATMVMKEFLKSQQWEREQAMRNQ